MLLDIVQKGTTDYSCVIRIVDSTDGTPETGVTFETSGIDLWYRRPQSAHTSITEATQTEGGAHSDGGFVHISDGYYRLDLPDAAVATGVDYVDIGGTVTGMVVIGGRIRLTDVNLSDGVRMGLTALPNAAADAAGGLPISDAGGLALDTLNANVSAILADTGTDGVRVSVGTGTGQLSITSGVVNANAVQISGDGPAADNAESFFDGTGYAGGTTPLNVNVSAMGANTLTASALATDAVTEVVNAIRATVVETEGSYTLQQALSIILAAVAGVTSNSGNTLATPNGNATRIAATVSSNTRTAMTLTPSS